MADLPSTWAELREQLGECSDDAREIVRRVTAPQRHAARARAAQDAAVAWIREHRPMLAEQSRDARLSALTLRLCEARGLYGGTITSPGQATERHPAFAACGKGRRHARDGSAWTGAIGDVALPAEMSPMPEHRWIILEGGGLACQWTVSWWDGPDYRHEDYGAVRLDELLEPEEHAAMLRHALRDTVTGSGILAGPMVDLCRALARVVDSADAARLIAEEAR